MDEELIKKRLSQWSVPEVDPEEREQMRAQALDDFRSATNSTHFGKSRLIPSWIIPAAGGALAASLGMILFTQTSTVDLSEKADWRETLRAGEQMLVETTALFPTQVKAIVENNSGTSLQTESQPRDANSRPVVIELTRGKERIRIVTFSGQRIMVQLGDEDEQLEVLVDADGSVLIAGDSFVWSKAERGELRGYQVHAEPLGVEL